LEVWFSQVREHRTLLDQRYFGRAKQLIQLTHLSLTQISLECGFCDQAHFRHIFTRSEGISPFAWRCRKVPEMKLKRSQTSALPLGMRLSFVVRTGATRHQQQVITLRVVIDKLIGVHQHAIGGAQRAALGPQSDQLIMAFWFQITIGDREHFHWPGHIEQQKIGKQHHCHGFHGSTSLIKKRINAKHWLNIMAKYALTAGKDCVNCHAKLST